ncbi:MAG: tripartite tricarboxylate transporter substrate binding protein [Betaproteobacteria bacterium]|nr:tripartite tricarboxylate transporter substrate binding protein [Betaproteobacteria bacterium]
MVKVAFIFKAAFLLFLFPLALKAQTDYPNKPIKFVIPFAAGTDQMTRPLLQSLSEKLGQPIVIDYQPGAATSIGASYVYRSNPDGYTLFLGTMASHVLNKLIYKKLNYEPDALSVVGMIGVIPSYLLVRADSPLRSVEDLIHAAKNSSGGLSYGTHAIGGPNHLVGEIFRIKAGVKEFVHVPYKGLRESSTDLLTGRIDFMWDAGAITLAQQGKLRALAVAYPERWPTLPNVPTMAEAGYPDVTISGFYMIAAAPATPNAILDKLNDTLRSVLNESDMKKRILDLNILPRAMSRSETTSFMKVQSEKWTPIMKSLNINLD